MKTIEVYTAQVEGYDALHMSSTGLNDLMYEVCEIHELAEEPLENRLLRWSGDDESTVRGGWLIMEDVDHLPVKVQGHHLRQRSGDKIMKAIITSEAVASLLVADWENAKQREQRFRMNKWEEIYEQISIVIMLVIDCGDHGEERDEIIDDLHTLRSVVHRHILDCIIEMRPVAA